jgi:hypothetical protein
MRQHGRETLIKPFFSEQIRNFTALQASKMIVELLRRVSDERLIRLTHLGERLTSDWEVLDAMRGVRHLLQDPDHSTKIIAESLFSSRASLRNQ